MLMNECEQIRAQMAFYLDDELHYGERAEFETHLNSCPDCSELCSQERRTLSAIRALSPLHISSQELRNKVSELIGAAPEAITAPSKLRDAIQNIIRPEPRKVFGLRPARALSLAVAGLAILLAALAFTLTRREIAPQLHQAVTAPSAFARMAVETHLRRIRGQLPLEIVSESPETISNWFSGKVSFSLTLPNYQESSGQEKLYYPEGARLVAFNNDYAAYVAYKMRQSPITLVVTSNAVAMPSGGEEIQSKGLKFHYDAINGLKVITWSDRGLTYALVSDLAERGQQSCMVCHAGTKDRDFLEDLKLR